MSWFSSDGQKREPDEETPLTESDWTPLGGRSSYGLESLRELREAFESRANRASSLVKRQVEGDAFEVAMMSFVVINALLIGFQIDHEHLLRPVYWYFLDGCFNTVYTVEILLRISVEGCSRYFIVPYNIGLVVATTVCWLALFGDLAAMETVQVLQLFRMVRLATIVPEIHTVLESFVMSIKKVGWVVILALMMFFVSSCAATCFIGHGAFQADPIRSHVSDNFKSIAESMFTLLEIMTLEGWNSYARPFVWTNPGLVVFIVAFIFVANLLLLNLITAVVVDNTLRCHRKEQQLEDRIAQIDKREHVRQLMLRVTDLNEGWTVTCSENMQAWVWNDEVLQDCLEKLAWKAPFFMSVVNFCEDTEGEVSLTCLSRALHDLHGQLTTSSYIHFHEQVAKRVEYIDQLCVLMLQTVAATLDLPVSEPSSGG